MSTSVSVTNKTVGVNVEVKEANQIVVGCGDSPGGSVGVNQQDFTNNRQTFFNQNTTPVSPIHGDEWFNTSTGEYSKYHNPPGAWVQKA